MVEKERTVEKEERKIKREKGEGEIDRENERKDERVIINVERL